MAVSNKFKLEKFDEKNDFRLWRIKMKAKLVHYCLVKALDGDELIISDKAIEKEKANLELDE